MPSPELQPVAIITSCDADATCFAWRGRKRWWLTALVKVGFRLRLGTTAVLADPQPALTGEILFEDDEDAVCLPDDFVPVKRRVDVVVVGSAYAPNRQPVTELEVGLKVAAIDKRLHIRGDRQWQRIAGQLRASEPQPFTEMPLRAGRALRTGDNPFGVKPTPKPGRRLPNLELAGGGSTAGFAPLSRRARANRSALNEAQVRWAERGLFREPPRLRVAYDFFQAAPQDQQLRRLAAVDVELVNLHPSVPRYATSIPLVRPALTAAVSCIGDPQALPLSCDTLWISPSRELAYVVWRGSVAIDPGALRADDALYLSLDGADREPESEAPTTIPPPAAAAPRDRHDTASLEDLGLTRRPRHDTAELDDAAATEDALPPWARKDTGELDERMLRRAVAPYTLAGTSAAAPPHDADEITGEPLLPGESALPFVSPWAPSVLAAPSAVPPPRPSVPSADTSPPPRAPEPVATTPPATRDPTSVTLSVYATWCAEIDLAPAADRRAILTSAGLNEATWLELQERFEKLGESEQQRFAHAYVERIELDRGPVSVHDFAELELAHASGDLAEVATMKAIPAAAYPHVARVWRVRLAETSILRAELQHARRLLSERP